jgi:hypothetical protein
MEKWMLRALLAAFAVLLAAAVIGSIDDAKRYAKIRAM